MCHRCACILFMFFLLCSHIRMVAADDMSTPELTPSAYINSSATPKSSNVTASDTSTMIVKYYQPETDISTLAYQIEMIYEAFEITRPEFGNYQLKPYGLARSSERQAALINEGKLLNLLTASPGTAIAKVDVIPVKVDILRGLLGYRICLINARTPPNLTQTVDAATLTHVRIGQGLDWTDFDIYKYNDIEPIQGPNLESLYPMLGFNRFDCIALGVNEVTFKYNEQKKQFPFLAIEPSLLIYYEFPIYFYVSKKFPLLAKRLQLGLNKLQESGRFDELFNQYHAQNLSSLQLSSRRVICLKSPYLHNKDQCTTAIQLPTDM